MKIGSYGMTLEVCAMRRTVLMLVAALFSFSACGGGARVIERKPVSTEVAPTPAAPVDPLAGFKGARHQPDEVFVLQNNPVAIVGPNLILRMVRIEWTESENGRGVIEKEGTAHVMVESGDDSKTLRMDVGESRGAFGWRVHLFKVDDLYREGQGDYVPQAEIKVTRDN